MRARFSGESLFLFSGFSAASRMFASLAILPTVLALTSPTSLATLLAFGLAASASTMRARVWGESRFLSLSSPPQAGCQLFWLSRSRRRIDAADFPGDGARVRIYPQRLRDLLTRFRGKFCRAALAGADSKLAGHDAYGRPIDAADLSGDRRPVRIAFAAPQRISCVSPGESWRESSAGRLR